jgi:hypothetical protein
MQSSDIHRMNDHAATNGVRSEKDEDKMNHGSHGPGLGHGYRPYTSHSGYYIRGVGNHRTFSNGHVYDFFGCRVNGRNANRW